ncbi:MAG: glycosyltransferase [Methyloprofundus sp.]|nr:glycosyltransferase [Methyloprofundus sp.]
MRTTLIEENHWFSRQLRKLLNFTSALVLRKESTWEYLRFYPAIIPIDYCFDEWDSAVKTIEYQHYQYWIDRHSVTLEQWQALQNKAQTWKNPPKLSIVTPVYNTQFAVLYECVVSVLAQAYPYWQLILVDDGSSTPETAALLKSAICRDPRIQIYFSEQSQGISTATNLAIEKSQGDYVIFLDHDDRLALDALYLIAAEIQQYPEVDILYSDRDMISPEGERYLHLFKPCWSPETLLAGNYIFHLMGYKRSLLEQLGGLRAEFDGSQDYDLILRAAETDPQVRHIPKVLYHWRQYQGSVALDSGAKDYAFEAGIRALDEAMQRRGIAAKASEVKHLWRGNYQLDFQCPASSEIELVSIAQILTKEEYVVIVNQSIEETDKPYIAIVSDALGAVNESAVAQLAAWLSIQGVALASGSIVSEEGQLHYAGATYRQGGELMIPYQGLPSHEPGYMAVTQLTHNVSAPHPCCVVIQRDLWLELNGLDKRYQGYYGMLDFSLRALALGYRCVSVPQAQFITHDMSLLGDYVAQDKQQFTEAWQAWLDAGDPYYNVNLERGSQEKAYHLPA